MNNGDQFVGAERDFRHEVAGLDVLRIGNPGGQIAGVSGQGAGGNGLAAADLRQIGAELSSGERPPDGMAEAAAPAAKQLLATDTERITWTARILVLLIAPAAIFVRRQGSDRECHMRVLCPAKFGALPAVNSWIPGGELYRILLSGDQVHLAGQARNPEAVNDVGGLELHRDGLPNRHADLIRGYKTQMRTIGLV